MAFANLSFETAGGSPGLAASWTFNHGSIPFGVPRFYADYHTGTDAQPWENFEREWNSNEDYLFAFELLDITVAEYQTNAITPKLAENFEEFWDSNQNYVFALAGIAAEYDGAPEAFEDFEEDWSSNQSYTYTFAGTVASYDGTPENFEDFEEDWDSNQSYVYDLGATVEANYDVAPEPVEDFEEDWTGFEMTTI